MLEFDNLFEYNGNPEKFLAWLRAIESTFDYEKYDDRKRCKLAVHQLTERAYSWHERLKSRRRREGKEEIQSWVELKEHLEQFFLYKQEEPERLFLETRDPPKPPMIKEKSDPPESILASMHKFINLLKEYQEATDAARKAQQQEGDENQEDQEPPVTSITKEEETYELPITSLAREKEETTDQQAHILTVPVVTSEDVAVKSPSLREIEFQDSPSSRQWCPSQPVLDDVKEDEEDATMLTMKKATDQQLQTQQATGLTSEETQVAPYTFEQAKEQPFQEREKRVPRKHGDTQRKQRSNRQESYMATLYQEHMDIDFFTALMSWNVHARSGLQLLIYDLRFEVESLQERECDARARGPNAYPKPSHVHPSSLGSKQASRIGSTSRIVIKKLVLDLIGLDFNMLKVKMSKAHEETSQKAHRRAHGRVKKRSKTCAETCAETCTEDTAVICRNLPSKFLY